MWSVKEVTDVERQNYVDKGCESHIPTGLRRIRVGGLASHPFPSIHVCSFFLSSLRRLCFEVLEFVPPFLFFLFLPGLAVETMLLHVSFMCASLFSNILYYHLLYS